MVVEKPTASVHMLAAHLVAHAQLVPSATNPRKKFDDAKLRELAESMKPPVGILEPLVVRHLGVDRAKLLGLNPPDQFFEIIAGERRWRAALIAGLTDIPIIVRDVDDEHVLRLQLIENKNREDVHPLDEAEAMERLLKLNRTETPKTIAAAIGMSERYVQNRLHYLRLVPDVKEAFRRDEITAGHVDLLMRLPADDQKRAFKDGCFADEFDFDGEKQTRRKVLASVRELGSWIKGHVRLSVTPKAPELELFPEVAAAVLEASVANAPKLVELSDDWFGGKTPDAPLGRVAWKPVKKGDACDHQVRGVLVLGTRRGTILTVCVGYGKCKKHFPETIPAPERPTEPGLSRPKQSLESEQAKREADKRRQQRARDEILEDIAKRVIDDLPKHIPKKPDEASLAIVLAEGHLKTWHEMVLEAARNLLDYGQIALETKRKALLLKPLGIDLVKMIADAEKPPEAKKPKQQDGPFTKVAKQLRAKQRVTMGDLGRKRGRRDGRANGASTARRGPRKAGSKK